MAIGWLTVLKSVPWSEVISNAPMVADGAKNLWSTVAKKSAEPEAPEAQAAPAASPEAQAIAALETRATALEYAVIDLRGQMLASSELIKALADQNGQLIARVESNRLRTVWLSAATAVFGIVALLCLGLAFSRWA